MERYEHLWVPGRFVMTNSLLSRARAAGVYVGRSHGRKLRPGFDVFAAEMARLKLEVRSVASSMQWTLCWDWPVDVRVVVVGHGRHDPDAWLLPAKAVVDGLAAAWRKNDRFVIGWVAGRVVSDAEDELRTLNGMGVYPVETQMHKPGIWVSLRQRGGG